jgi:hypothetical protein
MSEAEQKTPADTTALVRASLGKRYAAEKRFRLYGIVAIVASLGFLLILLVSIVSKGWPAFTQTFVQLDVELNADTLGISNTSTSAELKLFMPECETTMCASTTTTGGGTLHYLLRRTETGTNIFYRNILPAKVLFTNAAATYIQVCTFCELVPRLFK